MIDKTKAQTEGYSVAELSTRMDEEHAYKLAALKKLIPAFVNGDDSVNIDAIVDFVGSRNSSSNNKGYELTFAGKGLARYLADTETKKELKVEPKQSKNFDETGNVIIRGDNLDALKILRQSYYGKVKMIYIDPPYNTRGDEFVYADNFKQNAKGLIERLNLEEKTLDYIDNMYGTQTHSGWLAFMYPRLKLARELLANDGVMFISIDDNEQKNLKIICDEIFGEENCIGTILWNSTKSVTSTALISVGHTYNLIYAKEKNYFISNRMHFRLPEDGSGFSNPDNDPRGPWKADPFQVGGWRPNQQYAIVNPNTGVEYRPNADSSWKNDYDRFQKLMRDNRIVFGVSGEAGPQRKRFLDEAKNRGRVATTWWDDIDTTSNATTHVKNLFDNIAVFSNPKPVSLIERFIQLGDHTREGIILDFFGGSGTTAEAVIKFNKEDGGKRKFILVQWDEEIKQENSKPAYDFCKKNKLKPVISSICIERVHRAGEKIKDESDMLDQDVDIGYKVFFLTDKPQIEEVESQPQLSHQRQTTQDTLYNMIAASGQDLLTDPIEIIEPNMLYKINDSHYVLGECKTDLKSVGKVFIDGYADISLEKWLNMLGLNKENITILY